MAGGSDKAQGPSDQAQGSSDQARGSSDQAPGSSDQAPELEPCPIMEAWKALPGVMERASTTARICCCTGGISRQSVIDNCDILEPIINALGALARHILQ